MSVADFGDDLGPDEGHSVTGGFPPDPEASARLEHVLRPAAETEALRLRVAGLEAELAAETARREAAEEALPALEHRIGVSALTGEPLGISPEAAAAMAEAGLVMVRAGDLQRELLRPGSSESLSPGDAEAWNRLSAAVWGAAGTRTERGAGSDQGDAAAGLTERSRAAVCECGPGESCGTCREDA